jgi:CheY-like chemotaxis protein
VKEARGMKTNNSQAKILVIDDDPDYLKVVSLILKSGPYNVVSANNPQEGKEKLFTEKPDLILLDIMMDSLFDGFSLCHDIKTSQEYEKFRDIPIIFVSAVKEKAGSRFNFDSHEQGLRGPDDYIDKPVQPDDLFARIEKLLEK